MKGTSDVLSRDALGQGGVGEKPFTIQRLAPATLCVVAGRTYSLSQPVEKSPGNQWLTARQAEEPAKKKVRV